MTAENNIAPTARIVTEPQHATNISLLRSERYT